MAELNINSIYGGIQPTLNFGPEQSYLGARAIDPDENVGDRISGTISPVAYTQTTTAVKDVMWMEANDQDDDVYYYASDGKFGKIDVTGGTTEVSALTGASGNGLKYYNNYYYIARDEDLIRYGPMDGTPALETQMTDDNVTFSLSNKVMDTIGSYSIPNHQIFVHLNNRMYILDTDDKKRGVVHGLQSYDFLATDSVANFVTGETLTGGTSEATGTIMGTVDATEKGILLENIDGTFQSGETVTGTTGGSATTTDTTKNGYYPQKFRNELGLKDGYYPTCIEQIGMDLVIGAVSARDSKLFFWDAYADSFYIDPTLPYPIISAMINMNGGLFVFGGVDNFAIGQYAGEETVREIYKCDHGTLPLQGAVKGLVNRIVFGSEQSYPSTKGCVWSWNTQERALHNIANNTNQISALIAKDKDLITSDSSGIYEKDTSGYDSVWRSEIMNFSQPFTIDKVTVPFSGTLGYTTVKLILHYDNERVTDEHTVSLEDDSRTFTVYPDQQGTTNFYLEITLEGDDFVSVNLPIRISYTLNT